MVILASLAAGLAAGLLIGLILINRKYAKQARKRFRQSLAESAIAISDVLDSSPQGWTPEEESEYKELATRYNTEFWQGDTCRIGGGFSEPISAMYIGPSRKKLREAKEAGKNLDWRGYQG